MTRPDFSAIYVDPRDAELCAGFHDGYRPDSPEPGGNAHPLYVHGFWNGRRDKGLSPQVPAAELRARFEYLWEVFADEARHG